MIWMRSSILVSFNTSASAAAAQSLLSRFDRNCSRAAVGEAVVSYTCSEPLSFLAFFCSG